MEISFADIMYILHHKTANFFYTSHFPHIFHLDMIKTEFNFKLKVKMNNILMVFNGDKQYYHTV